MCANNYVCDRKQKKIIKSLGKLNEAKNRFREETGITLSFIIKL